MDEIIDLTNVDEEERPAANLVVENPEMAVAENPKVDQEEEVELNLPWRGVGPRPYTMAEKSKILNYLYRRHLISHYKKPLVYKMMIRDCPELADRTVEGLRALVRRVLPRVDGMRICMRAKQKFNEAFENSKATSAIKARHQAARQAEARKRRRAQEGKN